ncbi:3-deoxy-7-phosphoheptulonate synthase [Haloferula sp. A504]|uniref:3-deoxy-7-phosphoheptulonate synthase n=1 Tax=Haloferula sp. A504 TaxID=3373601 RepID=UPI0031CB2656|nr:3-deoxy-7-phosphoheptulonate synthase [Verrucomicrobiaceae bacterium E54]
MSSRVTDLHVARNIPLPAPALLQSEIPRSDEQASLVATSRDTIGSILFGDDPRFLVIVGPCSIHDTDAGLEYARRLASLAERLEDKLFIVMRVYFEKPRTTVGWKGLIMDPALDGSDNIPEGLRRARTFLRQVIDLGLPTATELLDPITPQYIADLISWSAIGARTAESQTHRQMASGLSMPVGFKNTVSGDLTAAINAVKAASREQTFLGVSEQGVASAVTTTGNPNCHVILRGGQAGPNHDRDSVRATREALEAAKLRPAILIDASHANCGKDDQLMAGVFREILEQRVEGDRSIIGAMLESNLVAGNQPFPQPLDQLVRGQSITDKCIDWETTEQLLHEAAESL